MSDFKISSTVHGDEAVVTCHGELDLAAAPEAEAHLREVETDGVTRIVLDLRPLDFLDSTGLRVVLAADSRARKQGRELQVVPGRDSVHRVFRIALLDRRLEFIEPPEEDETDA